MMLSLAGGATVSRASARENPMVLMTMMVECMAGRHDKCPGGESAPPGEFGGVICDCACHAPRSATSAAPVRPEVEHEFWRAIKDGHDLDDFELYLRQFPNGTYAELARAKLAHLKAAAAKDAPEPPPA
jgi:hypothetical protein